MSGEDVDILLQINDKWRARARALAAEAQVQAVREVCEAVSNATWSLPVENILRALDGDA